MTKRDKNYPRLGVDKSGPGPRVLKFVWLSFFPSNLDQPPHAYTQSQLWRTLGFEPLSLSHIWMHLKKRRGQMASLSVSGYLLSQFHSQPCLSVGLIVFYWCMYLHCMQQGLTRSRMQSSTICSVTRSRFIKHRGGLIKLPKQSGNKLIVMCLGLMGLSLSRQMPVSQMGKHDHHNQLSVYSSCHRVN